MGRVLDALAAKICDVGIQVFGGDAIQVAPWPDIGHEPREQPLVCLLRRDCPVYEQIETQRFLKLHSDTPP